MTAPRFVLTISRDDDGAVRIAARGLTGTVAAATPLPVPNVTRDPDGVRDWDEARRIGRELFAFAFPLAVDELLEESRHRAGEAPVTIALDVGEDRLAALPWELLFDPETERFLALSPGTPFTRSREDAVEPPPPEQGNLRARVLAPTIDEGVLTSAQALAPDPHVDIAAATPAAPTRRRPHVVILSGGLDPATAIPAKTPVAIIDGTLTDGHKALSRARSVIVLPPDLNNEHRTTLLRSCLARLALGETVEAAVVAARRTLAADHSVPPGDWAGPVLLTRTWPAPVVEPEQISTILGRRIMEHTVSWVQDAAAGVVSSVVVFVVGLVLYRLGFSSSSSFELDVLSPISLYQSFSALMIELSNYRDLFLLLVTGVLAAATAFVSFLWWRNRVIDPEEAAGFAAHLAGPLSRLRTLTFLAVATLTVAGSYGYQQYLWRVKLPIPDGALGVAVTRDNQTGEFQERLAATLAGPSSGQRVTVRELPVHYDAGDIGSARAVGKRIGAEAVIVYRVSTTNGKTGYTGYLVFTDPHLGRTFISRPPTVLTGAHPTPATATTRVQEGIGVPILRATSLDALAEAAAGVVDYQAGRIDAAIAHLERVHRMVNDQSDAGLVDFYLAGAYALDERIAEATATYAAAATAFETRATAERLGPQDELILVTTYLDLGNLARESGDWSTAIGWLLKGIAHRDQLLAQSSSLDSPSDVNEIYSRIYGALAAVYQATGDQEEEHFWTQRAEDELQTLADRTVHDRSGLVRLAATRLAVGDCVGAVDAVNDALTVAPGDADALLNAAAIAYLQADEATARTSLNAVALDDALSVRAHDELRLISSSTWVNPVAGYVEPALLATAEATFASVASPSGFTLQEGGAVAAWEGAALLEDVTALAGGDDLTAAKSRVEWSADPVRRQAAIDAYGRAIDRLTELAARRPNDPTVAAALASAYAGRMSAYAAGVAAGNDAAALLAADAAAVQSLADKILATDSRASRRDRLAAWALTLEALNDLRISGIGTPGGDAADSLRQAVDQATSEAQSAPAADDAEAAAIRAIYDEIVRYATTTAPDPARAAAAAAGRAGAVGPSAIDQSLMRSVCREARDRLAGDALLTAGDMAGAQSRYESALSIRPRYAPALIGLSAVRERQGDSPGAVAQAQAATESAPDLPAAWLQLGVARLAAGAPADRDAAFDRFFVLVAAEPGQVATADLRRAITDLTDLLTRQPAVAPATREVVPRFRAALDAAPDDGGYQLASRYAELGGLALAADDSATAEAILRRSLDLDGHQPLALTDLAVAVLVQGRDGTAEIRAALAETEAAIWIRAGIDRAELLDRMRARVDGYAARFPGRVDAVAPLADALAKAKAATMPAGGTPVAEASPEASPEAARGSPRAETPLDATPAAAATYTSQVFGFTLTMTDDWTIGQTIQQEGVDGVQISNGISVMNVVGVTWPDTTPAQCLQQRRSILAGDTSVSALTVMTDTNGKGIRGTEADRAFAAFRYSAQQQDGTVADVVTYISCRSYPIADTILLIEQTTLATNYEEQAAAREDVLATLTLPAQ